MEDGTCGLIRVYLHDADDGTERFFLEIYISARWASVEAPSHTFMTSIAFWYILI